jgi:Rhs element Vgr protein
MADSPTKLGEGVVEVEVLSNGISILQTMRVRSVTVRKAFNKIPVALIIIDDGNMAKQSFDISDADAFAPGAKIIIKASYKQVKQQIFVGVVVKHGIKISSENDSRLIIECKSEAVKLTVARRNVIYEKKKDSEILNTIISNCSLSSDVVATNTTYDELVQYNCTDWDFIMLRAEANALLVNVKEDKISIAKAAPSGSAVLTVEYGIDLYDFSADVDAQSQLSSVSSVAWDVDKQAIVKGVGTLSKLSGQGDLDQKKLAEVMGVKDFKLQSDTVLESNALKDWASGQLLRSGMARIRGKMTIQGSSKADVGAVIELKGVGSRFSGNVYTSAVVHRIANGNWLTEVDFGLGDEMYADSYSIKAPAASGLTAPVGGLHIGVVLKTDQDPHDKRFRVQLSLPLLQAETDQIWARMAGFYASSGFGAYFMPEVGDEVVVGYFNNDPSSPVILGSMYSSKNAAPYTPDADNTKKAIISKQKILIEFDDDKKVLTLTTPGKNKLVLDDDSGAITLQDQNDNKLTMDSSGITLKSPKDISISADGKFTVKAGTSLELTASTDLKASGMNTTLSAQQSLKASGQVSAELSASGNTTIKGAMVMIN